MLANIDQRPAERAAFVAALLHLLLLHRSPARNDAQRQIAHGRVLDVVIPGFDDVDRHAPFIAHPGTPLVVPLVIRPGLPQPCSYSLYIVNYHQVYITDNMTAQTHRERALEVACQQGIARGRYFDAVGVPRVYLRRLRDEGVLEQVGRGLYKLAGTVASTNTSLAEATRIQPKGIIGLLTALQFHNLTTQTPHAIWMLLGPKDWAPTNPSVSLKLFRASGEVLTAGVENHQIDGVAVPITSPAKTVADCFKYRNKIGLDVAIEALREFLKTQKVGAELSEIWRYAAIDRVQTVMRPYVEAMIS